MLYLQPTFPLIVYSWHEASAVYIKRASPRAGAELNIQAGLTLASAVAPLFVRGDNILSSPSVRWTVSWIPLTPRISISVNVADNLDVCRRCAVRASTGREKKSSVVECSLTGTLALTNLPRISRRFLMWNTYCASYYSVIFLFQLTPAFILVSRHWLESRQDSREVLQGLHVRQNSNKREKESKMSSGDETRDNRGGDGKSVSSLGPAYPSLAKAVAAEEETPFWSWCNRLKRLQWGPRLHRRVNLGPLQTDTLLTTANAKQQQQQHNIK